MAVAATHLLLPALHLAPHPAGLPLHAHVQPVCRRGHQETRPVQGALARRETHFALSPLGGQRL